MEYELGHDQNGEVDPSYVVRTDANGVVSHIPNNPNNKDWIEYQKSLDSEE